MALPLDCGAVLVINRKTGRAIDGPYEGRYKLFRWTKADPPPRKSRVNEKGWKKVTNASGKIIMLDKDEALRWRDRHELNDDTLAPTADEMIEAVADCLKQEMAEYMEWALSSPDILRRMHQVSLHGNYAGRKRLTRADW